MTIIDKSTGDFGSKIFASWRHAAETSWVNYVDHPFVRGPGNAG
jgi:hypothetical protein